MEDLTAGGILSLYVAIDPGALFGLADSGAGFGLCAVAGPARPERGCLAYGNIILHYRLGDNRVWSLYELSHRG